MNCTHEFKIDFLQEVGRNISVCCNCGLTQAKIELAQMRESRKCHCKYCDPNGVDAILSKQEVDFSCDL